MKHRFKRLVRIAGFAFLLLVLSTRPVSADVGNTGGFGGGGGGGSSGGSSSSGGSYYGGGGSSSGGSPLASLIVISGTGLVFIVLAKRQNQNGSASSFNTDNLDEDIVVGHICMDDPDFSATDFRAYVSELYITLQEAWEAKDWKTIRPFESNSLFLMHQKQLQEYIDHRKTNHLDMQDVREVTIADYVVSATQEIMTVRVNACCVDYITSDRSGRVISGNKETLHERSYCFEFIRAKGVKTVANQALMSVKCPNCGAPLNIADNGECEYCHSVVTNGKYGWLLNKYSAW